MKCKNWSNKLNNFVVRKLKSFKISGQQQVLSTMPAMPKEKSSPVPLADSSNYSDIMKERLVSTPANMTAVPANYSKVPNELMMSSSMSSKTATANDLTNSSKPIANGTSHITNQSKFLINNSWETAEYEAKIYYNFPTENLPRITQPHPQPPAAPQSVEFHLHRIPTTNNSVTTTSAGTTTIPATPSPQTTGKITQKPATPSRTTSTSSSTTPPTPSVVVPVKKSPNDYVFGKYIGEGSYSTVYLARDIHTHREYAIKVCDKQHILRERKQEYIRREREVMHIMNNVPGFVNLSCTFQDHRNLYFVMTYAKNSDLLPYINKVGSFDLECTCHYAAELVLAIENMHKRGVVHRDLKPENILLDENMHTLIADFGSAKILATEKTNNVAVTQPATTSAATTTTANNTESPATPTNNANNNVHNNMRRRGSFVGTAQYVSPEVLQGKETSKAADLWALGCIIYQMTSGLPPFRGGSDYLIFKEIMNLNLVFPEGFDKNAEDLVRQLLKIHPEDRIGAQDKDGRYESIRTHPFFEGINWDTVLLQTPPPIYPYLPGVHKDEELRSHYCVPHNLEPGLDDRQLTRLLGLELGTVSGGIELETKTEPENNFNLTETEKKRRLELQKTDKWNQFCDGEVILKKGFVNKRKGLFARKRMLLMTTGPRLIYIDPVQMVKKGEIPWSKELRVEPKNFKIFFVHTPNRTYYLEDPEGYALEWVKEIENVRQNTYGDVS